ncbi:MAG: OsmC family protein [Acidimicrobiaceae bacterium]|nr:OsmC family protein [Acidimicrobiaceae bacterium]
MTARCRQLEGRPAVSTPTLTVSARWLGAYRCDVSAGDFTIPVDEPERYGGTNQGPQPTELLLAALSSCFTLAVAHAAGKRGIELSHLGVEVTGTYDGPGFSALEIRVDVGCDDAVKDRLLEAAARVCYVSNTIRNTPEMSVRAV